MKRKISREAADAWVLLDAKVAQLEGITAGLRFLLEFNLAAQFADAADPVAECDAVFDAMKAANIGRPEGMPVADRDYLVVAGCMDELERMHDSVRQRLAGRAERLAA